MSKLRVLAAGVLATAMTAGIAIAPAAAVPVANAEVVVGHGIPAAVVDICVNDGSGQVEVKSNFRFGKWFRAMLPPGDYTFITRVASPGNCKGAALIKETFTLGEFDSFSVIATKTAGVPLYQVFDNYDSIIATGPAVAPTLVSVKHAAMLGRADVYLSILINDTIFGPDAAMPTLVGVPKGAQLTTELAPADVQVGVAKTGKSVLRETPYWELKPGYINHVVAIGGPNNFRFLRYRTALLVG